MTTPHEPGTPHYPEDPDVMEARLIKITQIQAQLGLDLLGPRSAIVLRAASADVLGRQADRCENLAHLYRRLAVSRGPRPRGEAMRSRATVGGPCGTPAALSRFTKRSTAIWT
jgi:hypothetical protein